MIERLTASDMLYIFCLLLGIIVAGILFFYEGYKRTQVRWFAAAHALISFILFVIFLYQTRLIEQVPHFYRTAGLCMLLYMPCSYLYVRGTLNGKGYSKWDWAHILPALLYMVDYSSFFFSSADHKLAFIRADFDRAVFDFSYGTFLPNSFYRVFLSGVPLVYWIAQVVLLLRFLRTKKDYQGLTANYDYIFKWICFYVLFQVLMLTSVYLFYLSDDVRPFFQVSFVFALMNSAFIVLSLFIHPSTVPGGPARDFVFPFKEKELPPDIPVHLSPQVLHEPVKDLLNQEVAQLPKHVKPLEKLTKKQISHMKYELEFYLQRNQSFLQHGYSLQELATALSLPLYQLSALINQEYGTNFNELINKYRIDHAIRIIKEGKYNHLNINGLADRCGFNNRNSFTNAFKRVTGLTPSDYFREYNSQ